MESAIRTGHLNSIQALLEEWDSDDATEQLTNTDDAGMAPIFYAASGRSHAAFRMIFSAMQDRLDSKKVTLYSSPEAYPFVDKCRCGGIWLMFGVALDDWKGRELKIIQANRLGFP